MTGPDAPRSRSAAGTAWAVAVVVALVALLVPAIAIPVARGGLTGLFGPSLGLAVPFALVGAFLLARGGSAVVAGLVAAIGVLAAASTLGAVLLFVAQADGSVQGATIARWFADLASIPTLAMLAPLGLLLPDGRLPSPGWRWLIGVDVTLGAGFVVLSALEPGGADLISTDPSILFDGHAHPPFAVTAAVMFLVLVSTIVVSIGALVARRRRAVGAERAQLTCLLFGGALNAVLLVATIPTPDNGWGFAVQAVTTTPLPIAIGVAVRRYRLYEIDRVVSRTVAYAVVLVLLAGVYAGVLAGLSALVPADLGQVGVAAATLAVTALAVPLTRRVRALVDRRFNRSRFDAERVLTAFAGRVRARPDAGEVADDLLAVVDHTIAPRSAAVWLVPR